MPLSHTHTVWQPGSKVTGAVAVSRAAPEISGVWSPTLSFNVNDCAFVPFDRKLEIGFAMTPVEIAAEVSAK